MGHPATYVSGLILLLLGAAASVEGQQGWEYRCTAQVPVEYQHAVEAVPIHLGNLAFFGSTDSSAGHIEVANEKDKVIRYYLLVLELLDSNERSILSVPIFNVDDIQKVPFNVAFQSWILAHWPGNYFEPISAKAAARKAFSIPITVLDCPAKARVSMILLRYDDGTEFKFVETPVTTAPVLTRASLAHAGDYRRWDGLTTTGIISVDIQGRGTLEASGPRSPEFNRWFQHQISTWEFAPAFTNGTATSGQIQFLLVVGDPSAAKVQLDLMKQKGMHGTVLVLSALPPELSFSQNWELIAGGEITTPEHKEKR